MTDLLSLDKELGEVFVWSSHTATNKITWSTEERIRKAVQDGYIILVGNNPYLAYTEKWEDYHKIRLSQVNSRNHGHSIRTIWAVKPRSR